MITDGLLRAHDRMAADLDRLAPDLCDPFAAAMPRAADTVGRRLAEALIREGLVTRRRPDAWHRFGQVRYQTSPSPDPARLLLDWLGDSADQRIHDLAAELTDAVVNQALAYARRRALDARLRATGQSTAIDALASDDPDDSACQLERLADEGHNLHPCGRTRLGWRTADLLAHDLETDQTAVGFVAVRQEYHLGDELVTALASGQPQLPVADAGYVLQPVHAWQRDAVIRTRYRDLVDAGAFQPRPDEIPAVPTAALRTLLLPRGVDGRRWYLKVAVDILVTSTRRTISVASTRNGPAISRLLSGLQQADPALGRIVVLEETAGAAVPVGSGRDLSALLRTGINDRLAPGESVVPATALPAHDPITGTAVVTTLVDRYARTRGISNRTVAAESFLDDYARLLLPPVLRLATCYGIGLEAHLQNCLVTFCGGVPHRLILRDFAGLRLHLPRLAEAGLNLTLWPGSVIATDSVDVLRAKVGYTALQAHLAELVVQLTDGCGLDEHRAWRGVRTVVDEIYDDLRGDAAAPAGAADADYTAMTAPHVPHKALVRMRLSGPGDLYVPVENALHDES